ncbi:hypothetical protein GCM10023215_52360 [Pseudonocardia yuanmonensis]|uniref:histidine kinase n=1 Tax=Pseudonocardia yuanmonensis TaxID=1095914 RepID=A0ABP8XGW1_9PSEU
MLFLVLASLGVVTLVTWRLLVAETDQRMDESLRSEVGEFARITGSGLDPATGLRFASVDEVLRTAITYNLARPNEKFLGYVDGAFRWESRQQAPVLLREDARFTALAGTVTAPTGGTYDSAAGEVRYLAVPVEPAGDPARGVVVVAYFADQEREFADRAALLMLLVGVGTTVLVAAGAWLVAGRILRPLRAVTATARTITDTGLSGRIPVRDGPDDAIGELTRTVNAMLDRVESGVDAQRRFVDDAGHELRTPITIVHGHLDVLDPADPVDVRDTVRLVDDELDRMNRMVTDLPRTRSRASRPSSRSTASTRARPGSRGSCGQAHRPTRRPSDSRTVAPSGIGPVQDTTVRRVPSASATASRTTAEPAGCTDTVTGRAERRVVPQASEAAASRPSEAGPVRGAAGFTVRRWGTGVAAR